MPHQYASRNSLFLVVAKIQEELKRASNSEDPFIKFLTTPLHKKFKKYLENNFFILATIVVLDLRLKMATMHNKVHVRCSLRWEVEEEELDSHSNSV